MDTLVILLLAAFMGLASVDLFSTFWLSFLGVVATFLLWQAGRLRGVAALSRLQGHLIRFLLCGGLLAVAFAVYVRILGLGMSEMESLAYLMGVLVRLGFFATRVRARIDALFAVDDDDGC